jgi:hypothetical protein
LSSFWSLCWPTSDLEAAVSLNDIVYPSQNTFLQ